ncbi:MAG: hypothetical protein Kow0031_30860 [Anaerolineae bacterium]
MTPTTAKPTPQNRSPLWKFIDSVPGARRLKNLNIGVRLLIGFGVMIFITFLVVTCSYLGSSVATESINTTSAVRVPTALSAARAQASLLKMLGDVRGYLALGQPEFRESYETDRVAFEAQLAELQSYKPNLSPDNRERLVELEKTFIEWSALPDKLFELRNDQLEREPAYKILATDGILMGGSVLIDLNQMIEVQSAREPTADNIELLSDMAQFQGTFASMLSGLRGYVTTRNRLFKGEYEANLGANEFHWNRLRNKRNSLTPEQQALLDAIEQNRASFLELPEEMFAVLESPQWRQDLYLFSTEAVPMTDKMQDLLAAITNEQQSLLQLELASGRRQLISANQQILISGFVALLLGIGLAFIFRENIAGPIRRLTSVADEIRTGDLDARAEVESSDEIGTLAGTFNEMTDQLSHTLQQVRKEKRRADDLLEVVIPIGVELSAEKDFNRLLEKMLVEAKTFCHANGGVLYLRRENEELLRPAIVRNDRLGIALGGATNNKVAYNPLPLKDENGEPNHQLVVTHVALDGTLVNIANTRQSGEFEFGATSRNAVADYQDATSMLVLPLKNPQGKVLGVMQLLDPSDPESGQVQSFDQNLTQMMSSFSSLASAALEAYIREQSLKQEIHQLRIEIDEAKRQQQVSEIVDTDFFTDLQARAQEIRRRGRRSRAAKSDTETESETDDES